MDRESAVQLTSLVLNTANLTAIGLRAQARAKLLSPEESEAATSGLRAMARRLEAAGHDDLASQLWIVAGQIETLRESE